MNVRMLLLWGMIAVLLLQPACQNPAGPENQVTSIPTSVRGTVMRNDNLEPIGNAIVYDIGGLARDTSKADGSFKLTYQLLSQTKSTIIGARAGFGNDTAFVTLNPGVDTTVSLRLRADSSSPSGLISSGKAANIVLVASGDENIAIRGTGANETAVLLFEVRDSLGISIASANKVIVNFAIQGGPGGGEYVYPVSAQTDPLTGRVLTTVTSGTKAGVLQVFATATVPGTTPPLTITSRPIRITIAGGLPSADHFSISRRPINIAGGVYDNLRATIMVIVGDKEGNPVQAGTAVSFTTTGGIIQPNALTDKDGLAQVDLISGNPRPPNSVAVVTAKTIGDSGKVITQSITVLFTGSSRILTPSSTVIIPDSGVASFQYRVQDSNGFPLVGGTTIALTVDGPGSGALELSGDVTKTLEDSGDPSTTLFNATVRDKQLKGPAGAITFKITVTSQNGNTSATFPGIVLSDTGKAPPVIVPGGSPSKSGYASNLTLVGEIPNDVSVRGTGANESVRFTFVARDSVGNTVDIAKRAYVTFQIAPSGGVGGGEFLFPTGDSTDVSGLVSTTFNSGTAAGVLQVIAQTVVGGRTIKSAPVPVTIYGGLPDQKHFTSKLSMQNMPGLAVDPVPVGGVTVQIGDKFGNPVRPVDVYFTTSGGLITAKSRTRAIDGHAEAILYGGKPFPQDNGVPGLGHVILQTVGENNSVVSDTIPFLFSGPGTITLVNVVNDTVKIFDGTFVDVDYSVGDVYGNPITGGSNISIAVTGLGAPGVTLSGDINVLTTDTRDRNLQRYRFRVQDAVPNGGPSGDLVFTVSVNGTVVRRFFGVLYPSTQVSTIIPPSARQPSQIAFLNITNPDIYVAGVGNIENSVISYEVRDSLGVPIDRTKRVQAFFNLTFQPNSYTGGGTIPTVIPATDSTDDSGKLRASIVSGTQAGVVTIVVSVVLPNGGIVKSLPVKLTVHAGFADQGHFTLIPSRYVFPGTGQSPAFSVAVGDTFSNPVQSGTAIYFNSQAGIMATGNTSGGSYTDTKGFAVTNLFTVNPTPYGNPLYTYIPGPTDPYYTQMGGPAALRVGYEWVWATTQGKAGSRVADSVLVVWNLAPIIVTGVPGATIALPQGGTSAPITITVKDVNGNPLCDGTTIIVSITFTSDVPGIAFGVDGDLSSAVGFVMPVAAYARFPGVGVTDFTFNVSDLSTGGGATFGQTLLVQVAINSPGLAQKTVSFHCKIQ